MKPDSIASRFRETASVKPPDQSREVVPEARKEESKERPAAGAAGSHGGHAAVEDKSVPAGTIVVFVDEYPGGEGYRQNIDPAGRASRARKATALAGAPVPDLPASDSVRANPDSAVFALRTPSVKPAVADEDDF